jgi:hypothetical protein
MRSPGTFGSKYDLSNCEDLATKVIYYRALGFKASCILRFKASLEWLDRELVEDRKQNDNAKEYVCGVGVNGAS